MRGYRGSWHKDKKLSADRRGKSIGDAECVHATRKAILVALGKNQFWIPQSAVHDDSDVWLVGHKGKLVVQSWWAERRGL